MTVRFREETYRRIVEAAHGAFIIVDQAGTISFVNAQAERLFGYEPQELLGRPVEVLVPARVRPAHGAFRDAFLAAPSARPMGAGRDLHAARKDGTEFPVEIGLEPLETEGERFVLCTVVDISRRRRDEARFRLVVESAPNAIVLVDGAGTILLVNSQTEQMFGCPRAELVGRSVELLVPERFRARHPAYRDAFFADPRARPMGAGRDLFGRRSDGSEFPIEIGLNPIATDEGTIVLSAIVDITERKRVEGQLRATADDLARSNTDLEQFAYVASHDLQEPLRMISSFLELLQRKHGAKLDADGLRYIEYAVDGARRMHAMITDLLAYSRAGRADTELDVVACDEALAGALANLKRAIADSGAEVTAEPLPRVRGNAVQLQQVFQNLVENALKYRGEAPPRVHVSARREGATWRLSVRDNGLGIAPRFSERVFRVFQRLHERGKYPGTGIGLAIVKRIVERHGGRVWVESEEGRGATFHFTLGAAGGEGLA